MPPRNRNYSGGRQRGQTGFGGAPQRGQTGFNQYPSQAQALTDAYQRERLIDMEEKESQRSFNEEYGPRYFEYLEGMDVSDPDFEKTIRSFDYEAKKIPGFTDALSNKRAERAEWVDADNARIDLENDKITANNKILEDNQKETDAFDDKQIASLPPSQQRAFKIARQNGDVDTQNDLLGRAYESGDKKFTDAAAKATKDADTAAYKAESTRLSKGNASTENQIAGIDKELAPLQAKYDALEKWEQQTPDARKDQTEKGNAPVNLSADELERMKSLSNDKNALSTSLKEGNLVIDRRNYKDGKKKGDSLMDKSSDGARVEKSQQDMDFIGRENENNTQQKGIIDKRIQSNDAALKKAKDSLQTFNNAALEEDSDSFTDEQYEQYTALNKAVEDLTMSELELKEQSDGLSKSIELGQKQAATQQEGMTQYREEVYQSTLDSRGEFQDNNAETDFDTVYNAYARDNKLAKDPTKGPKGGEANYDYRRAYAEGDLTIDTEGELPAKWRKEGHPKLYKHPSKEEFSAEPKEGYIDTRNGTVVDNEEDLPDGQAAARSLDS